MTTQWGGIVNDPVLLRLAEDRFWLALADSDALLYAKGVAACAGDGRRHPRKPTWRRCRSRGHGRRTSSATSSATRWPTCATTAAPRPRVDGIPVVVSRTGWTGEVGYELYLRDTSRGDDLLDAVMQAGEPFGARVDRAERGSTDRGRDLQLRLRHARRGHAVARQRSREVRGARPGAGLPRPGRARAARRGRRRPQARRDRHRRRADDGRRRAQRLLARCSAPGVDAAIGRVTAGAWSPRLEKNIGYAWVPASLREPGTELEVRSSTGPRPATVSELPFFDPAKQVPVS